MSLAFAAGTATTNEAVGTYNLAVNRTGTSTGAASVEYRVNGGTAAGNGVDFSLAEGLLNFASGETSKTIPTAIVQDQLPEQAETIIVQLLNQTGANLGTSSHTLTVNNLSMPEAFSDPATAVIATGATQNGRVMPGGIATSYWFQFGLTPVYGQVTPAQNPAAGIAIPVPLETGLNTVQIEVTAQDVVTLQLCTLQITRPPGYTQWSAAAGITGTTNVGPLDDFNGGGSGALELDRTTLNSPGQPISRQLPPTSGGSPEWCAIFIRRKDHAQAGLTYTPHFSANLGIWQPSTATPTIHADDGIYQAVCIPYPEIEGQPARFFKLGVSMAS